MVYPINNRPIIKCSISQVKSWKLGLVTDVRETLGNIDMFCQANKRQDMHWPAQHNFFFSQLSDLGFFARAHHSKDLMRHVICIWWDICHFENLIAISFQKPGLGQTSEACMFFSRFVRASRLSFVTSNLHGEIAPSGTCLSCRSHGRSGPHSAGFSDKNPQRIWTRRAWHWKDRRAPCAQLEDIVRELLGKLFPLGPSGVEWSAQKPVHKQRLVGGPARKHWVTFWHGACARKRLLSAPGTRAPEKTWRCGCSKGCHAAQICVSFLEAHPQIQCSSW